MHGETAKLVQQLFNGDTHRYTKRQKASTSLFLQIMKNWLKREQILYFEIKSILSLTLQTSARTHTHLHSATKSIY